MQSKQKKNRVINRIDRINCSTATKNTFQTINHIYCTFDNNRTTFTASIRQFTKAAHYFKLRFLCQQTKQTKSYNQQTNSFMDWKKKTTKKLVFFLSIKSPSDYSSQCDKHINKRAKEYVRTNKTQTNEKRVLNKWWQTQCPTSKTTNNSKDNTNNITTIAITAATNYTNTVEWTEGKKKMPIITDFSSNRQNKKNVHFLLIIIRYLTFYSTDNQYRENKLKGIKMKQTNWNFSVVHNFFLCWHKPPVTVSIFIKLEITSRFNTLLMDGNKQIEIILIKVYSRNCVIQFQCMRNQDISLFFVLLFLLP